MTKWFVTTVLLALLLAAAAWYFFNGGVSHGDICAVVRHESGELGARLDERCDALETKLDRIEGKLDRLLEIAERPPSDALRAVP